MMQKNVNLLFAKLKMSNIHYLNEIKEYEDLNSFFRIKNGAVLSSNKLLQGRNSVEVTFLTSNILLRFKSVPNLIYQIVNSLPMRNRL